MYGELVDESLRYLDDYPHKDPVRRLKDRVKSLLGKSVEDTDPVCWPIGLLLLGLTDALLSGENAQLINDAFWKQMKKWDAGFLRVRSVENTLSAAAFLNFHRLTSNKNYLAAGSELYRYLKKHPTDAAGSYIYNPASGNGRIFADMLGMACPFLFLYGQEFEDPEAFDLGILQLENFQKYGMDEKTHLPYHAYVLNSEEALPGSEKLGLVGWGRAVGWMMMGYSFALAFADKSHPAYEKISSDFDRLCKTVFGYQKDDGSFGWKLVSDDPDEKEIKSDTSATAMILMSAVRAGMMDDRIRLGIGFLKANIKGGCVNGALAECIDVGVHPQKYGSYPWSVGPTLSVLALSDETI